MDCQSAARATRAIIINSASVISTVTVKGRGSTLRNGCLQALQLLVLRFTGQSLPCVYQSHDDMRWQRWLTVFWLNTFFVSQGVEF